MNNTATNIVALEKPRVVGHVQPDPRTVAAPPPACQIRQQQVSNK